MKKLLSGLSKHYITSMQGWHWQVSANIVLNYGLNRFKLVRQKQFSASFCHCTVFTSSRTLANLVFCYRMLRRKIAADEYYT